MKELKNNKAKYYVDCYLLTTDYELWHAYSSCSPRKYNSYENIKRRMNDEGGSDIRILSHNCNFYTCAYKLNNDLIIDTYCNTYIVKDFMQYAEV